MRVPGKCRVTRAKDRSNNGVEPKGSRRQQAAGSRQQAAGSRQQPEILTLREKLLALGGVEIVALPPLTHGLDHFVPSLAKLGTVMEGTVTHKDREPNNCHLNAAKLWKERKKGSGLIGIGTGYALSDDGLWGGHSWALTKGGIIETTLPRVKYFGVAFTGEGADLFVNISSPTSGVDELS